MNTLDKTDLSAMGTVQAETEPTGWRDIDLAPAPDPYEGDPERFLVWVANGGPNGEGQADIGWVELSVKGSRRRPRAVCHYGKGWEITHFRPLPDPPKE